jgi:hypothetical protein
LKSPLLALIFKLENVGQSDLAPNLSASNRIITDHSSDAFCITINARWTSLLEKQILNIDIFRLLFVNFEWTTLFTTYALVRLRKTIATWVVLIQGVLS